MKEDNLQVGCLAVSKAGRDKGNIYLILSRQDEQYVRLVDGNHRKIFNPKLKKIKHIQPLDIEISKIKEKLLNNVKVFDSEIYSAIKKAVDADQEN